MSIIKNIKNLISKIYRNKKLFVPTLVVLISVISLGGWFGYQKLNAAGSHGCEKDYGRLANQPGLTYEWSEGNYWYQVRRFYLTADVGSSYGTYVQSEADNCDDNNPATIYDDSLIDVDGDEVSWNSSSSGYEGGLVRPDAVWLGVENFPGNNDGQWIDYDQSGLPKCVPHIPDNRPPVYRCGFGRTSVFVDDGGGMVIKNASDQNQLVYCVNIRNPGFRMGDYFLETMNPLCGPDAADQSVYPQGNGSGQLFVAGNCPHWSNDNMQPPPGGNPSETYRILCETSDDPFDYYRNFISSNNLTDFIGRSSGVLRNFRVYMDVRQTQPGGFGNLAHMTFRYDIPSEPVVQLTKVLPSGVTQYDPGDNVTYRIDLRRTSCSSRDVKSLVINDDISDSAPVSLRNPASSYTHTVSSIPSGRRVTWVINSSTNSALLNRINSCDSDGNPRTASLNLLLVAEDVAGGTCSTGANQFQNQVSGSGFTYAPGTDPAIIVSGDDAPQICVVPPRDPYLTTSGGDVHAGSKVGEPCFIAPGHSGWQSAQIIGQANGSLAQYVVSAAGPSITDFGSNSGATNHSLKFGRNGNYGTICRPDKVTELLAPLDGDTTSDGSTYMSRTVSNGEVLDIQTLPDNSIYRIRFPGGSGSNSVVRLSGGIGINRRITLVVDGSVFIGSNITLNFALTSSNPATLPAFGLLAKRSIYINPSVGAIQGVYSSGYDSSTSDVDKLDTCRSWPVSSDQPNITQNGGASACNTQLNIRGSIAANRIRFRRTFSSVAGGMPAEYVQFEPAILVSVPPGLSKLSGYKYIGERPPLF